MSMKHFTRTMMLAAALGSAAYAQAQVFELDNEKSNNLAPVHRQTPAIGDFNGDGIPDFYYGGQGFEKENSKWSWDITKNTYDDEGNVIGTEQGRQDLGWWVVGYLFESNGAGTWNWNASYGPLQGQEFGALGLPPSTYSTGRWFDYNNDGKLDLYILGKNEYGWEPSTTPDGWYSLLYKNEGDKFSQESGAVFPTGDNEKRNPSRNNSSISFGDYDRDGYTDVVIQCYNRWYDGDEEKSARLVGLYKNNGDGTFTLQNVFNPIPYDDNKHPADLFDTNEETFVTTPTMVAKPMSHGAVIFGDLNNDGWLDIVSTGYSNDGIVFYIYKNNGDGTFQELDLEGKPFVGVYESELALADINNDGWLDIISYGTDDVPDSQKRADIYLNACDGEFNFDLNTVGQGNGLYGESEACVRVVDLNHDGLVDIISSGWSHVEGGWNTRVFYQQPDGTFALQQSLRHMDSGGWEIADLDGDGAIDLIGGGWGSSGATEQVNGTFTEFYAGLETDGIEAPEAPTEVSANYADGKLTVTWNGVDGEPGYSYNVYVKNTETGAISQIIPAVIETGKLKAFHSMQTAIRSEEAEGMTYTITVGSGKYEVGVQTIKPDWTTSAFTTTEVVTNGIQNLKAETDDNATEYTYSISGARVNNGGHGVFIVKKDNKVTKVIR